MFSFFNCIIKESKLLVYTSLEWLWKMLRFVEKNSVHRQVLEKKVKYFLFMSIMAERAKTKKFQLSKREDTQKYMLGTYLNV